MTFRTHLRLLCSALASDLRRDFYVLTGRRAQARAERSRWHLRHLRADRHRVVCCRCQRGIRAGNPALPSTAGLCPPCRAAERAYVASLYADAGRAVRPPATDRVSVSALAGVTSRTVPAAATLSVNLSL